MDKHAEVRIGETPCECGSISEKIVKDAEDKKHPVCLKCAARLKGQEKSAELRPS